MTGSDSDPAIRLAAFHWLAQAAETHSRHSMVEHYAVDNRLIRAFAYPSM